MSHFQKEKKREKKGALQKQLVSTNKTDRTGVIYNYIVLTDSILASEMVEYRKNRFIETDMIDVALGIFLFNVF